ncbi:hypothetical protein TorRG33x02_116950 [Trema orientale]|uniref:Uncharacterized protein n=1 Tax=Trema orientale TaxID=63057 RepID=A0A2P5F472_TREOI|nr:hypothetical protein TorRG33x02_116950 [Trema orientale]
MNDLFMYPNCDWWDWSSLSRLMSNKVCEYNWNWTLLLLTKEKVDSILPHGECSNSLSSRDIFFIFKRPFFRRGPSFRKIDFIRSNDFWIWLRRSCEIYLH